MPFDLSHYNNYQLSFNPRSLAERVGWRKENYYWYRFAEGIAMVIFIARNNLYLTVAEAAKTIGLTEDIAKLIDKGYICLTIADLRLLSEIFNVELLSRSTRIAPLLQDGKLTLKELARMDADGIEVFSDDVYKYSFSPATVRYENFKRIIGER